MRILLIPNSYPPVLGGLQTVTHALAKHLQQRNHQARVVTNHYPRSLPAQDVLDTIPVNRWLFLWPNFHNLRRGRPDLFLASFYFYPSTLLRLVRLFQTFRPEVVNVHFPDAQIPFVLWLRQRFDFRLIVSLHGHEVLRWFESKTAGGNSQQVVSKLRTILQQADAITACSRYLLDKINELEPEVSDKGYAIYNGIDLRRFSDTIPHPHPRPYIFAYGRLANHKGFDMLLTAFAQITGYSQIDLIIAGDGEEKPALQLQMQRLGLDGRVHLFGRATQPDVVKLLNGCEFVVVPSRREPFGIVALEAMAAGKPVLATRVGGLPEVVKGQANRLVEPTIEDLTLGLKEWFGRRNELKISSESNRAKAAAYTWDKTADQYLQVYYS